MNSIIRFPKRLKYSKVNPLEDFYKKCMIAINKEPDLSGVQVWAFSINNKDYIKLTKLVKKHVKKRFPYLVRKKLIFEVGMIMLDIGPRVKKIVPEGFVEVNKEELYEVTDNENTKQNH